MGEEGTGGWGSWVSKFQVPSKLNGTSVNETVVAWSQTRLKASGSRKKRRVRLESWVEHGGTDLEGNDVAVPAGLEQGYFLPEIGALLAVVQNLDGHRLGASPDGFIHLQHDVQ